MVVALAALAAAGAALAAAVPSLLLFFAGSLPTDSVDLCSRSSVLSVFVVWREVDSCGWWGGRV